MPTQDPRLIIVNQFVTPTFMEWLAALAAQYGVVELWTGNAPAQLPPGVRLRPAPAYNRSSVGARLRTWLHFAGVVGLALLKDKPATPLFVTTNPPVLPLLAWLLSLLRRRPFGLLEYDIYPQILVPLGQAKASGLPYRLWYRWHGRVLRQARLVITLGEQMAHILKTMAGAPHLPVAVIPNWANTEWIRPRPRLDNPFAQQCGLGDKLTVVYSGNLGATHAIETILAVAEKLAHHSQICFLIIGEGAKKPLVEAALSAGRVPTLQVWPYQPAELLPFTLSSADVAIVTLAEGYEGLSMPSKTYSMLAAGNAILGISRAPNDLAATIAAHHCGANFAPEAVEAIAAWLQELAADRANLAQLQTRARQAAVDHYSAPHCCTRLNEAVGQLLLQPAQVQSS